MLVVQRQALSAHIRSICAVLLITPPRFHRNRRPFSFGIAAHFGAENTTAISPAFSGFAISLVSCTGVFNCLHTAYIKWSFQVPKLATRFLELRSAGLKQRRNCRALENKREYCKKLHLRYSRKHQINNRISNSIRSRAHTAV